MEGWLLSGFWNCSQDFGVAPRVLEQIVIFHSTVYEKSFKKGTLRPKIEIMALIPLLTVCVKIFAGKIITNFSPSSLWRSYSFD